MVELSPEPEIPATASRKRVKAMPAPAEMVVCRRCGGHEFIESRIGIIRKSGKSSGGTKALLCVPCLTGGERVAVL